MSKDRGRKEVKKPKASKGYDLMATASKVRSGFVDSEEGIAIKQKLIAMASDATYNTESSYHANSDNYADHLIPFVDKHMNYLNNHPKLDANMYLANLRLMTRVR